ncbi:MAG: hypothetical protein PHW04_15580 [Candidatus Wallbacteria bacterium]|nr:hypothetical protein [Candidatus Wallbacteria bacterium]
MTDSEKKIILSLAEKYHVRELFLFGSSLEDSHPEDIDLGVSGIAPELFFEFYGELFRNCQMPVDLVDLSDDTSFTRLVRRHGAKIYG